MIDYRSDNLWLMHKRNNPNGKLPGSVWYFPHVAGTFKERKLHPAQFPEAMIERIVLACTNSSDNILDPFNGSGTTGVVAIRNGRTFTGIEKDTSYFVEATDRILAASCLYG